jgi:hypothetical protein
MEHPAGKSLAAVAFNDNEIGIDSLSPSDDRLGCGKVSLRRGTDLQTAPAQTHCDPLELPYIACVGVPLPGFEPLVGRPVGIDMDRLIDRVKQLQARSQSAREPRCLRDQTMPLRAGVPDGDENQPNGFHGFLDAP